MYNLGPLHRCSRSCISRRKFPLQARLVFHIRCTTTTTSPAQTKEQSSVISKWLFPFSLILLACGGAYFASSRRRGNQAQIDLTIFHPFEIVSKQSVSSTCSIFTLRSHTSPYRNLYRDAWEKGVWSVQIKQPQLQIARSYTPLPPPPPPPDGVSDEGGGDSTELRFLIRREPHGEVSGYLHNLPIGAVVHVRGLNLEYEVPSDVDEVLFIAGGTGIAPALQVAYSILERRKSTGGLLPKMHILWANRRREDAMGGTSVVGSSDARRPWNRFFWATDQPTRQPQASLSSSPPSHPASIIPEINHLKQASQGKISLDYFIDEESSHITQDLLKTYLTNHINPPHPHPHPHSQAPTLRGLIMISGPDAFVSHYAGPKIWTGRHESQGPLGGSLKGINMAACWDVWKL